MRKLWLFPVAVLFHNLEESIWMPRFWNSKGWRPVSATEFRVLALGLAILAFIVTYLVVRRQHKIAIYALVIFCVAMLVNVFWHIGVAVYLHGYAPGVLTAVFLVLPVTAYMLFSMFKDRLLSFAAQD